MRYALADDFVQGEEVTLAAEGLALGSGDAPTGVEQSPHEVVRKPLQGGEVGSRNDEGVAVEDWPNVEERQDRGVVGHHVSRGASEGYLVEYASRRERDITLWGLCRT